MKILFQFFIILLFTFLGELISSILPFSFPASIIGLLLLFIFLVLKLVKVKHLDEVSNYLQKNMAILFVPLCVGVMQYFDIIKLNLIEIIVLLVVSTVVTFIVVGLIAKRGLKNE